ncbi:MAG: NAD(P)/FAD-dependent oxidoreductase, partial [Proteobacteria bacterium]|nr:NAD(P)/FAD-dependent oxidoreductase [Pseudomonadota bacterium]
MTSRQKLVVIGNGMAGVACVEKILARDPERFDITIFGAERRPNYDRIQLSSVLAGKTNWRDIVLNSEEWYEANNIRVHLGHEVTAIDRERKLVSASGGLEETYDKLIVATGSRAFILPIPGVDKEGVFVFRTIDDCEAMIEASRKYKRAVVIGGGLLGLEAAYGLRTLGMDVSVVHLEAWLMERQLDATGGAYLARKIRDQGVEVLLSSMTEAITGNGRVTGLQIKDREVLETDFVVMTAGIRANSELGREAGLDCGRGIVVDDFMRTSDPDIFAVGECAEHRGICYGLVAPLYEQGNVLAAEITGQDTPPYEGSNPSTKLKVSGVDVFSTGEIQEADGDDVVRSEDSMSGEYKKVVIRDGKLAGVVLVGDISQAPALDRAVRSGEVWTQDSMALLAPPSGNGAAGPVDLLEEAASAPDDSIVCGCNGVTKQCIVQAIQSQGLTSRKEVAGCTNASRSCGGCGPQVEALIQLVHGEAATQHKKTLCECTALTRNEVVGAIRQEGYTAVSETMEGLDWEGEGCAVCRPAINYFLTMCWPGENEDDPRSRFVNERVHANIQKDGTYSVVPRIYGGVTTADELMRIAQTAKKYNVPKIKITGGQRIDLLGVAKHDLPKIWEELDMPSGFAYAKAVRTVKTCVGSDFCRFGTRDSMGLGIRIEKTFENLWTPAKVKMAVNACPRNCAESLIKDVGLIAVDQAWEIYVGGNGGTKIREAELLCTVESDDEALQIIAAFLQF